MQGGALIATKAVIGIGRAVLKAAMFSAYVLLPLEFALEKLMTGICAVAGDFLALWII